MVIGPVEAGVREARLQPAEEGFVPDVHPEHDVRLPPVSAERAFPNQQPNDYPGVKRIQTRRMFHENHYGETNAGPWCFTVMIPVEHQPKVQSPV
jgi:hypothetical protein